MKRKWIPVSVVLLLVALAYVFLFELAIPFAARSNIPMKWQQVPLGHKRTIVHDYLGAPIADEWESKGDEWRIKAKANTVFLNIGYDKDTVANRYRIGFVYRTWLGERVYYLAEDTI